MKQGAEAMTIGLQGTKVLLTGMSKLISSNLPDYVAPLRGQRFILAVW